MSKLYAKDKKVANALDDDCVFDVEAVQIGLGDEGGNPDITQGAEELAPKYL